MNNNTTQRPPAAVLKQWRAQKEKAVTNSVKDYLTLRGWRSVRMQRTVIPGAFQTGEPGIPDFLFLRYMEAGTALALWIEFKRTSTGVKSRQQTEWHEKERKLGALTLFVGDQTEMSVESFIAFYDKNYGWLHEGTQATGHHQLTLSTPNGQQT